MVISSLIENLNLNFNRAVFNIWDTHSLDPSFELNPRDFLYFAKDDITSNSVKGLANSLTNAKRAIDCQIDLALAVFGINYDKIPKLSNPIVEICGLNKIDIPYKFKLMQALDFAPGQLVSKIRMKRHRLGG